MAGGSWRPVLDGGVDADESYESFRARFSGVRPAIRLWQFAPDTQRSSETVIWIDAGVLETMRGDAFYSTEDSRGWSDPTLSPPADPEAARVLVMQCEAFVRRSCRRGKDCDKFGLTPKETRAWAESWTPDATQVFVVEVGFNAEGRVCKVGANVPPLPGDDAKVAERYIRVNHTGAWGVFRTVAVKRSRVVKGTAHAYRAIERCVGDCYLKDWRPEFKLLGAQPCVNNIALLPGHSVTPDTWVLDMAAVRTPVLWTNCAIDVDDE